MNGAIILAAGRGRRMQSACNKPYLSLAGHSVLSYSLKTFAQCDRIDRIVLVVHPEEVLQAQEVLAEASIPQEKIIFVHGGKERQDSVRNALEAAPKDWEKVLIHDGARPLLTEDLINRVLEGIGPGIGVVPGIKVSDTIKEVDDEGYVQKTFHRDYLRAVQTPQGFLCQELLSLHQNALADAITVTDDASLFEHYGFKIKLVEGENQNQKMTLPDDLAIAEYFLKKKGD